MSERRGRRSQRVTEAPRPPVEPPISDFARQFSAVLRGATVPQEEASPQVKKEVDGFLEKELMPQVKEVAVDLLKEEIRDKLERDPSAIAKLREAVKQHKEVLIKRKRGCIYIQCGTGTPKDPIDEILIAST